MKVKDLTYVRRIWSVGSGGVYIFKDSLGNQYTLKMNKGKNFRERLPLEIIADSIYKSLGFSVPDFVVYKRLPKALRKGKALRKKRGMVRIAQFIPSRKINTSKKIAILKKGLQDKFAILFAFMNSDLKVKNFIIDSVNDGPWFIDNDMFLPPPSAKRILYSYDRPTIRQDIRRFKKFTSVRRWYQNVGMQTIKKQIRSFLKRKKKIIRIFNRVSKKVNLPNRHRYLMVLKTRFKALRRFVRKR